MSVKPVVVVWLVIGLVMLYFQIIIGGITRLTGSGLSITKWEIVTGTFPPTTDLDWQVEFDKYKETPQYAKINEGMELGSSVFDGGTFKFIYFWEYFHRLWARTMGFVFLIPFVCFVYFKMIPLSLKRDLSVVVGLAALAATFGWIMVASGLVNRPWVNAYKLSIHLTIGVSVFLYLLWTTLKYVYSHVSLSSSLRICRSYTFRFFILLAVQVFMGGIMSGMKAALIYPTWPDIGGEFIPSVLLSINNWSLESFIHYDTGSFAFALAHLFHRSLAYIILLVMVHYWWKYRLSDDRGIVSWSYYIFCLLVLCQVIVGIITLVSSVGFIPVSWGVLHQGIAVLVIGSFLVHYNAVKRVS